MTSKLVRAFLAKIGRKGGKIGGKAEGASKRRGGAEYYRKLAQMRKKKSGSEL